MTTTNEGTFVPWENRIIPFARKWHGKRVKFSEIMSALVRMSVSFRVRISVRIRDRITMFLLLRSDYNAKYI